MKAPKPGIYKRTSRELAKMPVISVETQNLTIEEVKELEKTIRNLERKRSHSNKPRLLHNIRNIVN